MEDKTHENGCPQGLYDPQALEEIFTTSTECICDNRTLITSADVTEGWISDATASDYYSVTTDNYAQIEHSLAEYEYEGKTFTPSNLQLYDPQAILAEFTGDHLFILYNDEGQDLVTVNLSDGDITYGENYTPDKAAQVFWDSIGEVKVGEASAQLTSEYEQLNVSAPPGIADDMPESYVSKIEKQIELLEDAVVIYKEHRPSDIELFDDAMKVID